MPKSRKGKSKDGEEHPPVTQYFNFPEEWIKEYDPQVHGYVPEKYFRPPPNQYNAQGQLPLNPGQQPFKGQTPVQPQGYPAGPYFQGNASQPQPAYPVQNPQWSPQWNPTGVYGGLPDKPKNGGVPWWAWVIIVLLVLVIILFVASFLKLYPSF